MPTFRRHHFLTCSIDCETTTNYIFRGSPALFDDSYFGFDCLYDLRSHHGAHYTFFRDRQSPSLRRIDPIPTSMVSAREAEFLTDPPQSASSQLSFSGDGPAQLPEHSLGLGQKNQGVQPNIDDAGSRPPYIHVRPIASLAQGILIFPRPCLRAVRAE